MIESTSSTAPNPAQSVANAAPAKPAEKPVLSSDFETFLKMLTAQMRNQDPLNPVEIRGFRRAAGGLLDSRTTGAHQ